MKRQIAGPIIRTAAAIFPLLWITGAAPAQQVLSTKAGIVQYIEGEVFLVSRLLQDPQVHGSSSYFQMENGQILRTGLGRAELLLHPYTYLRLGENSLLRMEQNRLDDSRLALEQGCALVEVVKKMSGNSLRVRVSTSAVEISKVGLYRLDAGSSELRVYGGTAQVTIGNRRVTIKSGRMVRLEGSLASSKFDANAADSLHKWAARRSFNLFLATADTRKQMMNWKPISLGWLRNSNYRMRFYSELAFNEWSRQEDHLEQSRIEALKRAESDERQRQEEDLRAKLEALAAAKAEAERAAAAKAQQGTGQAPSPSPEPPK